MKLYDAWDPRDPARFGREGSRKATEVKSDN